VGMVWWRGSRRWMGQHLGCNIEEIVLNMLVQQLDILGSPDEELESQELEHSVAES